MAREESAQTAEPAIDIGREGGGDGLATGAGRAVAAAAERGVRAAWAWAVRERVNLGIVAALTIGAALLRIPNLGGVPLGLHGDEGWTGLDARRILDEGWIGPYVISALGQPTGPLYFTALIFRLFGDSIESLRLSMALLGVATIPFTFMAFSLMFNRTTGLFAALFLLAMTWHLHLSRMAFMVIAWPLMEMVTLWALWLAFKRCSIWLYAIAGLALGLGVYTYNAYVLFIPVPFVALLSMFFHQRSSERGRYLLMCGAFAVAALAAAASLINYVNENRYEYRMHQRVVNVLYSEGWKQADTTERADMLWERAQDWHEGLFFGGIADLGDGLSTEGHPPVDPLIYVLALIGLGMAFWRWRRPEYIVLIAAVLLLPWGAILTTLAGMYRRTLGLAPFVAVLAALPLAWAFDRLWASAGRGRYLALALFIAPLIAGARATHEYFGPTQDTAHVRFVMVQELAAASKYMDSLPPGTHIYFYSGRWFFEYETRRFIAPDAVGTDRSRRGAALPGALDLSIGVDGPAAFVFLPPYAAIDDPPAHCHQPPLDLRVMEQVRSRYPEGEATQHVVDGCVFYQAYFVP